MSSKKQILGGLPKTKYKYQKVNTDSFQSLSFNVWILPVMASIQTLNNTSVFIGVGIMQPQPFGNLTKHFMYVNAPFLFFFFFKGRVDKTHADINVPL